MLSGGGVCKRGVVRLQFHPMDAYPAETRLTWEELLDCVETSFSANVEAAIVKLFRKATFTLGIETMAEEGVSDKRKGGAGVDAEGEGGSGEAAGGDEGEGAEATHARNAATLNDGDAADDDENREVCTPHISRSRVDCDSAMCLQLHTHNDRQSHVRRQR